MNIENAKILLAWLRAGAPHAHLDMSFGVIDADNYVETLGGSYFDERSKNEVRESLPPECGTVCCIAGAADQLKQGNGVFPPLAVYDRDVAVGGSKDWEATGESALDWLGLEFVSYDECMDRWDVNYDSDMFHPLFDPGLAPDNCTPDQAADALERVMNDEFPWPDSLPKREDA